MICKTLKIGLLTVLAFTFSYNVAAQDKKQPNFEKILKRFDSDKSGAISLEEFTNAKRKREVTTERLEKKYKRLDADGDGALTIVEMKENWKKTSGKRKDKGKAKKMKKQDAF